MAKKKTRKRTIDRLAKKRGLRSVESRLRRKKAPKVSRKAPPLNEEETRAAEVALLRSPLLLSSPQFANFSVGSQKLTDYLEEVKAGGPEDPSVFLSEGLKRLFDEPLLEEIKVKLSVLAEAAREEHPETAFSASLVLSLAGRVKDLSAIPFFAALFIREVKNHPLAEDPAVWKVLSPFLPPRIVKPEAREEPEEKSEFTRSKKYPHLVLPKGSSEDGGQ